MLSGSVGEGPPMTHLFFILFDDFFIRGYAFELQLVVGVLPAKIFGGEVLEGRAGCRQVNHVHCHWCGRRE